MDTTIIDMNLPLINSSNTQSSRSQVVNYSSILEERGIKYMASEYYWQVGEITKVQGWIIHLSAIKVQLWHLLNLIIPHLTKVNIPFKIVKDSETAGDLLTGALGYTNLGKVVSIYPDNDLLAIDISTELIDLTKSFRGPSIPTDYHLGGIVYTRYGSFKPIIQKGPDGKSGKYIRNGRGELLKDSYSIPFKFPKNIPFPFEGITASVLPKHGKLLNDLYYPVSTLKNDAKGKVIKALYFKRFWQIKSCLIKEGYKDMFADSYGRDMHDRLKWQYKLHKELAPDLPLPKIIDFFKEGETQHLVMDFIKGTTITDWLSSIYKDRSWCDLSSATQIQIVNILSQIVAIIKALHGKGFVHRDITTENFILSKRNQLFLIDMELAWSVFESKPLPPFSLGTPGYMSPEQQSCNTPTIKEDIYALGSLIIAMVTNLFPAQIPINDHNHLQQSLVFFTKNVKLTKLISDCLQDEPLNRPELKFVGENLDEFRDNIIQHSACNDDPVFSAILVPDTISSGIKGLASTEILSAKGYWISRKEVKDDEIGNEQLEMALYEGWHTGISGPLWLLARAKSAGFQIDSCLDLYYQNWDFIQTRVFAEQNSLNPSLFSGSSGIAITIAEGIDSALLITGDEIQQNLLACFSKRTKILNISNGIAGQGIALIRSIDHLEKEAVSTLLRFYVESIINKQEKNGSWENISSEKAGDDFKFGFEDGLLGIIWFLIAYNNVNKDKEVESRITKGLNYILDRAYTPGLKRKMKGPSSAGMALVLIKAFETLKDEYYLASAKKALKSVANHPISYNFTLDRGLARIGELYLDVYDITGDSKYFENATWLANLFCHTHHKRSISDGFWLTGKTTITTADLFSGNSGILHFLIRHQSGSKLSHPLWPGKCNLLK